MLVGAFARIIPHMPNFTPTEGLTLFGAAYLSRKYLAILLPILMIYASDFVLNNTILRVYFTEQEGIIWFSNYMIFTIISIVAIVGIGSVLLKKVSFLNVGISAFVSSLAFFLISNFGVWLSSTLMYSKGFAGLIAVYTAGLPFFKTTLISSLVFTSIIFGSFELLKYAAFKKSSSQV